ncbi:MAG: hypothetical protein AAF757_25570 [Cyanobacteria bacterium P01_D01_bin.116]
MVAIRAHLPRDLPPYSTVFWHYKQWRAEGIMENIRSGSASASAPTG